MYLFDKGLLSLYNASMVNKIKGAISLSLKKIVTSVTIFKNLNIHVISAIILTFVVVLSVLINFYSIDRKVDNKIVEVEQINPISVSQIEINENDDIAFELELRRTYIKESTNKLTKVMEKKVLRASGNVSGKEMTVIHDDDYETLLKIVEAEATDEDILGKQLVANVILNRVESNEFPNSIHAVVHQRIKGKAQFSPIDDGRFYSVKISDTTRKAVDGVLRGEDKSEKALFFVAKSLTSRKASSWFDDNLEFLFKHGVHSFYKY